MDKHLLFTDLEDEKVYFSELIKPNYYEFQIIYYADMQERAPDALIFRRTVNLALTLNHLLDKVRGSTHYQTQTLFIDHIKSRYQQDGDAVDLVRRFVFDVKNREKLIPAQHRLISDVVDTFQHRELLPDWALQVNGATLSPNLCEAVIITSAFWGKFLAGEKPL